MVHSTYSIKKPYVRQEEVRSADMKMGAGKQKGGQS